MYPDHRFSQALIAERYGPRTQRRTPTRSDSRS